MLLSELAEKELVEISKGARFGFLANTECVLDGKTGKIIRFELQPNRFKLKQQHEQVLNVYWEQIEVIGVDRVLFKQSKAKG